MGYEKDLNHILQQSIGINDQFQIGSAVDYIPVQGAKVKVEWAFRGVDLFLQVFVPPETLPIWQNIKHRDTYLRMIEIIRKSIPDSLEAYYGAPTNMSPAVTVKIENFVVIPFERHVAQQIAEALANELY